MNKEKKDAGLCILFFVIHFELFSKPMTN